MTKAEKFNKANAVFFFIGLLGFSLPRISEFLSLVSPWPEITLFINSHFFFIHFATLLSYAVGYLLLIIGNRLYPDQPSKARSWYGFAQFKNQGLMAAVVGLVAISTFGIGSFLIPAALVYANWLFVVSNVIWLISEYHKKNNAPRYDKNFSTASQTYYVLFAFFITLIAFSTAILDTVKLLCPVISPLATLLFLVAKVLLAEIAILSWFGYKLNPRKRESGSHQIKPSLDYELNQNIEIEAIQYASPVYGNLFTETKKGKNSIQFNDSNQGTLSFF